MLVLVNTTQNVQIVDHVEGQFDPTDVGGLQELAHSAQFQISVQIDAYKL